MTLEQLKAKIRVSIGAECTAAVGQWTSGSHLKWGQVSRASTQVKNLYKLTSNIHFQYLYFKWISVVNHRHGAPATWAILQSPSKVQMNNSATGLQLSCIIPAMLPPAWLLRAWCFVDNISWCWNDSGKQLQSLSLPHCEAMGWFNALFLMVVSQANVSDTEISSRRKVYLWWLPQLPDGRWPQGRARGPSARRRWSPGPSWLPAAWRTAEWPAACPPAGRWHKHSQSPFLTLSDLHGSLRWVVKEIQLSSIYLVQF